MAVSGWLHATGFQGAAALPTIDDLQALVPIIHAPVVGSNASPATRHDGPRSSADATRHVGGKAAVPGEPRMEPLILEPPALLQGVLGVGKCAGAAARGLAGGALEGGRNVPPVPTILSATNPPHCGAIHGHLCRLRVAGDGATRGPTTVREGATPYGMRGGTNGCLQNAM
jgi:hypothetical protein